MSIINYMINYSLGTMFVNLIDISFMKSKEKIYEFLDKFMKEIGEENIFQVITDNGSNYGKIYLLNC